MITRHTVLSGMTAVAGKILRPIASRPAFFAAILLLGSITPAAEMVISRNSLKTLFIISTIVCFTWSYLFTLLISAIGNGKVRKTLQALILTLFSVKALCEVISIAMSGDIITPETIQLILETNSNEANGFIGQYFSWTVVVWVLVFAMYVLAGVWVFAKCVYRLHPKKGIRLMLAAGCVGCICMGIARIARLGGFAGYTRYADLWEWCGRVTLKPRWDNRCLVNYTDPVLKPLFIYKTIALINADVDTWRDRQAEAFKEPAISAPGRDFNVVIVIGESFIRRHSNLYGYSLTTNPRLTAERGSSRLVVFDDMMTTANFTTASIRNTLNLSSISRGEQWSSGVYFPMVVKKSGHPVYHYDNQATPGGTDFGLKSIFYTPLNLEEVYDGVSDSLFELDGEYIDYVHRHQPANSSSLTIYHLMGQHFPCNERYTPPGHFSLDEIAEAHPALNASEAENVMHYDNATYYNDSVVGRIINYRSDTPTLLFYFSDHGEDIDDLAKVRSRKVQQPDDPAWIDRQYHIPFFAWMSAGFIEQYPDLAERIASSSSRPGSLDDIGHGILGLLGIASPFYRAERDIFNEAYEAVPRVAEAGYPLDR